MAGDWLFKTLGDLAHLHEEQVNPAVEPDGWFQHFSIPAYDEGRSPSVEQGSSIGSRKFTVPYDAILLSKLNPRIPRVWEPVLSTEARAVCSTEFLVLRPREGTDRRYLRFVCLSPQLRSEMEARVTGTSGSHQRVRPEDALSIQVKVPGDIREQSAIGHALGALDDKIELNRRMNETLEAIASALFKSWFIDFDPVRAKAEGCDTGLPSEVAEQFPNRLVASEVGEIPDGWDVKTIGESVKVVGGSTPSTQEIRYWNGSHYFATPRDLSALSSRLLLRAERTLTDEGVARISSGVLPIGTVLLSSRAPIGYVAVARVPVSVNQGFIAMVCDGALGSYYVLQWAAANVEIFKQNAGGTTFAEISKRIFRPMPMVVPSPVVAARFEDAVSPLYEAIENNLWECETLAALRDSLLPKLLSGAMRVNGARKSP